MNLKPLDVAGECARGNALAYLSIIIGGLLGIFITPLIVWKKYKKSSSIQVANI